MLCQNCQKENPESAKVCVHCGKPLHDTPPAFHPPKEEEDVVLKMEKQPSAAPRPNHSKTPMIVAIVLGGLIVLGIGFAVLFGLQFSQQMDQKDDQIQDLMEENDQAWESLQEEREARQDAEEKAQEDDLWDQEDPWEDSVPFDPGTYVANYNMVLRKGPDYDADRVGSLKKDESVVIQSVQEGASQSYWGKTSSGSFVCIQDPDYTYLRKSD